MSGVEYNSNIAGGVFVFSGGTDTITFGEYNFLDNSDITTTAWVYPRNGTSFNTLIGTIGGGSNRNGFKMGWYSSYEMIFEAGNASTGGSRSTDPNTIIENEWQHIAYVFSRNGRTIKFYRNGLLIGTMQTVLPSSGTVSGGGYQYYKIGTMTDNSNPMTADLGELKVYKTQKTLNEIFDEYYATKVKYGL